MVSTWYKFWGLVILVCLVSLPGQAEPAGAESFSYDNYGAALQEFVNQEGMVNYRGLKANPKKLHDFLQALTQLPPGDYQQWQKGQQIAFWINAYNALTLKAILDHYPIKASLLGALRFPKNSIRQIPGVWTNLQFPVMGRQMTLDEIEHDTLRSKFNEPRIHMALVCAAKGCPPLRNEPFTGENLDQQLNDQTRRFLANPQQFRIDRAQEQVSLSPIFKWFGQDFIETYGTIAGFSRFNPKERAVLNFIQKYLAKEGREFLSSGNYAISYLKYDWSLNEQQGK